MKTHPARIAAYVLVAVNMTVAVIGYYTASYWSLLALILGCTAFLGCCLGDPDQGGIRRERRQEGGPFGEVRVEVQTADGTTIRQSSRYGVFNADPARQLQYVTDQVKAELGRIGVEK